MKNYKLGVIGHGYVGESQSFAFSPSFDVRVYDKDSLKSTHSLNEVLDSDFVFVCVPTPMKKDGSQDLSFVENFFKNAKEITETKAAHTTTLSLRSAPFCTQEY